MSGRLALNLYGYLISSARTPSVQALFGEHCCLFADSFGEWCSGPKQKHSRRCLLLIRISLHASACSFSIETINSLPDSASLNHSRNLSMSTSACYRVPDSHPVSSLRIVQMFREKCEFLRVQRCVGGLTCTSEAFLPLEAAAVEELQNTLSRVPCLSTADLMELLKELMTSPFGAATRSSLQRAFNAKRSNVPVSNKSCIAKMMLGLQYLIYLYRPIYGSLQILVVFCKPRNSFSSSSHRLN